MIVFKNKTSYLQTRVSSFQYNQQFILSRYEKEIFSIILLSLFVIAGCSQKNKESQNEREINFAKTGQWANYGNDPGGMRYSPLKQINTGNVKNLKPAWTYQSGELKTYEGTRYRGKSCF